MTITNGYLTLVEFQTSLDPTGQAKWSASDSTRQELAIESASRWIDDHTKTRFYASTETRYYTPRYTDILYLKDDLLSVTTLKADSNGDATHNETWATTDYILLPINASSNGEPFREIQVDLRQGDYSFPKGVQKGIEIVGSFGYSSGTSVQAPKAVKDACRILAMEVYLSKNMPLGTAGSGSVLGTQTGRGLTGAYEKAALALRAISRRGGYF